MQPVNILYKLATSIMRPWLARPPFPGQFSVSTTMTPALLLFSHQPQTTNEDVTPAFSARQACKAGGNEKASGERFEKAYMDSN